jgi:hypothetical protein
MFEVGKTYKTRDGREAKVVHLFQVGALVVCGDVFWYVQPDGHYWPEGTDRRDLMPPRLEAWGVKNTKGVLVGVYQTGLAAAQHAADYVGGATVFRFIEVEDQP